MAINVRQYRDRDLTIDEKVIGFYDREFYVFSNFSSFETDLFGQTYKTTEHAYQSAKFFGVDWKLAEEVKNTKSAHGAFKLARANADKVRSDWDKVKLDVMEEIVRAKLNQHPYVKQKLLETGDYDIVEDSPKDSFWGWGPDRNGQNWLGKIWMKLRSELREEV